MHVLHPLFVHLHIALLLMAFITMYYWLFKGLATSIFENRIYSLARLNTTAGLVFVVLSMVFGIRDGLAGNRSEEHTSELQSRLHLVCRLLLEKKKKKDRRLSGCLDV